LLRPAASGAERPTHLLIKPRHFVTEIAAHLHDLWPDTRSVMAYRSADQVIASTFRLSLGPLGLWLPRGAVRGAGRLGKYLPRGPWSTRVWLKLLTPAMRAELEDLCPLFRSRPLEEWAAQGAVSVSLALWVSVMRHYQRLCAEGQAMAAVRYADLIAHPAATLTALFTHLDLPLSALADALEELSKDPQRGTSLARDVGQPVRLTARERGVIQEYLAGVPELLKADALLLHTLGRGPA